MEMVLRVLRGERERRREEGEEGGEGPDGFGWFVIGGPAPTRVPSVCETLLSFYTCGLRVVSVLVSDLDQPR